VILLLIRHGQAAKPPGETALRLTARGQKEAAQAAQALRERQIRPTCLWHSPKARAIETADILAEKLGFPSMDREQKKELAPEGNPRKIYEDLMAERPPTLALVSHLPFLEKLAFLIQEQMGHPLELRFPTAGIQAFRFDGGWEKLFDFEPDAL